MEDKLDQLFREKLANHRLTPTENAWGQIQQQLAAKRRKIWMKRLAMAASILIFLSAGYVSFRYIRQPDTRSPVAAQHEHAEKTETSQIIDEQGVAEEKTIAKSELNETSGATNDTGTTVNNKPSNGPEAHPYPEEHNSALLVKKENIETPEKKTGVVAKEEPDLPEQVMEELPAPQTETLLAINGGEDKTETEAPLSTESDNRTHHSPAIVKDYPSITVTYKASQNSELLARKDTGILNKGLKKISKFSDERIVTDEVKAKLRNTREDLLALNFGKIINRSNKDLEN